jgi:hypothetical protein
MIPTAAQGFSIEAIGAVAVLTMQSFQEWLGVLVGISIAFAVLRWVFSFLPRFAAWGFGSALSYTRDDIGTHRLRGNVPGIPARRLSAKGARYRRETNRLELRSVEAQIARDMAEMRSQEASRREADSIVDDELEYVRW